MYRSMHRSPDDAYDISNLQGPCPSPNTAALMVPYGTMTPAPVSRTSDGKPRVMDLNNLGCMNGATQSQTYTQPSQKSYNETTGHSNFEKTRGPLDDVYSPDSIYDWKEEQRMNKALNHAHQAYMRDVHGVVTPIDDVCDPMTRPSKPIPIQSPLGWEQDKALRARRANDRIQQEYVNELRMISGPIVKASTPGEVQLDQMRARMQAKQQLDISRYGSSRLQSPSPSRNYSSIPTLTSTVISGPPVTLLPQSSASTWTEEQPRRAKQTVIDEAREKEIELDEKRKQLMAKKHGKPGKSKKKKKDKHQNHGVSKKEAHFGQQLGQHPTPYQPTSQHTDMLPAQYLSQQPGCQPSHQTGQQLGPQKAVTEMQYLPHRPSAPPKKGDEDGESFNKRRRRLIAKVAGKEGEEVCIVIKDIFPKMNPCSADVINQAFTTDADTVARGGPKSAPTEAVKAERYIDNPNVYQSHKISSNDTSKAIAHPALIQRQTSQHAIGWNSDAAKRGLGFKSKLRREPVQETIVKKPENQTGLTPEIRNKWKKATFF